MLGGEEEICANAKNALASTVVFPSTVLTKKERTRFMPAQSVMVEKINCSLRIALPRSYQPCKPHAQEQAREGFGHATNGFHQM